MPEPHNQIMIWADDMFDPFWFREHLGGAVKTPNLDRFCERATRFSSAYCVTPICLTSRSATMTGWSPAQSGILSNGDVDWYERIPSRDNLSATLRRAGYHIGWAGKVMHLYGLQPIQ